MSERDRAPTVALTTLGCKVNLYETGRMRARFEELGFRVVDNESDADVCVVNTCSVTCAAEAKSRKTIGRLARRHPSALLVVTGCDVEMARIMGRSFPASVMVVPNAAKLDLPRAVAQRLPHYVSMGAETPAGQAQSAAERTRALIKAQDGCDMFCTYCSVPLTRGPVRSRPMQEVIAEVHRAADLGHREVVVTGVLVGSYGRDLGDHAPDLADLIEAICAVPGVERVRLSSIEPTQVTDRLLSVASSAPEFCAHLHLPLQSGDNGILRAMNRPYTREMYADICARASAMIPDLGITTDILVGFPGETAAAHENTLALVAQVGFARAHVFRYSKRPTTPAAEYPDHIADSVISERAAEVAQAARKTQRQFAERCIGRALDVLVEPGQGEAGLSGYTPNYIRVSFKGPRTLVGQVVRVQLDAVAQDGVLGHLASDAMPAVA